MAAQAAAMPVAAAPRAFPSLRLLVGGALLWALAMLASFLAYQWLRYGLNNFHLKALGIIYFSGACLGWLSALPVARLVTRGKPRQTQFAAYLFGLTVATVSFTGFLFSMQFRQFYAQWHAPFGTKVWFIQFMETGISALYQFLVLGLPQYLPIAFPALLAVSFVLSRRMR